MSNEVLPPMTLYIPACNAERTLDRCLRAISRQTLKPEEVLVIDDGSRDETANIACRHGVRLIQHKQNRGLAAARNTAVKAARNELVASLDSDLVARPDWLERLARNFGGGAPASRAQSVRSAVPAFQPSCLPASSLAGCCGQVVEKYTRSLADRWRSVHMSLSLGDRREDAPRFLLCGVSLMRRSAILEVGGFDERCRSAYDDVDMSARLRAAGYGLRYDPAAVAVHLKRSAPRDIIRGFWSYWAAKNEMEGAYRSLSAAVELMLRRQMGIAAYRLEQDVHHRRYDLLPLTLLIPLTFCVRDLDKLTAAGRISQETAHTLGGELAAINRALLKQHLPRLAGRVPLRCAFADGSVPPARTDRIAPALRRYRESFTAELDAVLSKAARLTARKRIV